jgi:hypothetical protein
VFCYAETSSLPSVYVSPFLLHASRPC